MHDYAFTLILEDDPTEEQTSTLYGYFGAEGKAPESVRDVLIGKTSGRPYAACIVRGASFDHAVRDVLEGFRREGIAVVRIELDQEAVQLLTAA